MELVIGSIVLAVLITIVMGVRAHTKSQQKLPTIILSETLPNKSIKKDWVDTGLDG